LDSYSVIFFCISAVATVCEPAQFIQDIQDMILINPSLVVNRTHFKYLYMRLSVYLVGSLLARLAILCDCDPR